MDPTTTTQAAMGAFFDLKTLLSYQNMLVVIAAWFIIETLKKMAPVFWRGDTARGVGPKLLSLMPMLVCQALVWATMTMQPESTPGERVVLGLVLAFLTAHAHDVFKRFGLHKYVPVLGIKLKEGVGGPETSAAVPATEMRKGQPR